MKWLNGTVPHCLVLAVVVGVVLFEVKAHRRDA